MTSSTNVKLVEHKKLGYVIDPTEPLPKRWKDERGPIRVMCEPIEGYIMARRPGAAPFILSMRELLRGDYEPILKKPTTNICTAVDALLKEIGGET